MTARLIAPCGPGHGEARLAAAPGMRIGLFGGSFNPAHAGHLAIAREGLKRLALDRVWWMVTPQNPIKSADGMAGLAERLKSARAQAADPRIVVTDMETRIGARYTIETARWARRRFPETAFVWLAGADILSEMHKWNDWQALAETIPFAFFDRPGHGLSALARPFAVRYRNFRLDEGDAQALPLLSPPAWTLLHIPLRHETATALRNGQNRLE